MAHLCIAACAHQRSLLTRRCAAGVVLSDSEVLDIVTEAKPTLRKLPFDDFVSVMCRPLSSTQTVKDEVRDSFKVFVEDGQNAITPGSLRRAMDEMGHPVSDLMVSRARHRSTPPPPLPSLPAHPASSPSGRARRCCRRAT